MRSNMLPYRHALSASPQKVAIPRAQQRGGRSHDTAGDRTRVSIACTPCRVHKKKCTGEKPSCTNCHVAGRECAYVSSRRDRVKALTERCVQMAGLLSALKTQVGNENGARIASLLATVEEDVSEIRHAPALPLLATDIASAAAATIENLARPLDGIGEASLKVLDKDVLHDEPVRTIGFMEESSEWQGLRKLVLQLGCADHDSITEPSLTTSRNRQCFDTFKAWNVHLEGFAGPYELPIAEAAESLLDGYATTVHDTFPILPVETLREFRWYLREGNNVNACHLNPRWQAMLNVVLAIGARHSQLVEADWHAKEQDYVKHSVQVRALGADEIVMIDHPDVPQIQTAGLLAFYYLSVGQMSRSWTVMGAAVRSACALGLHLRNEDPTIPSTTKDLLARTWWSIHSLDRLLSSVTGRLSIVADLGCSAPLPTSLLELEPSGVIGTTNPLRQAPYSFPSANSASSPATDSLAFAMLPTSANRTVGLANSESCFKAVVQLDIVAQDILASLYSARSTVRSLHFIQENMSQLDQRLESWARALPDELSIHNVSVQAYSCERAVLRGYFYSAKILLTCPCLESSGWAAKDEHLPEAFAFRMTSCCVDAAKAIVSHLPEHPNARSLYECGPWWCSVHPLKQAVSVFLLALASSAPGSHDITILSWYVNKSIKWLGVAQGIGAERAYEIAVRALEVIIARLSLDPRSFGIDGVASESAGSGIPGLSSPLSTRLPQQNHQQRLHVMIFTFNKGCIGRLCCF